MGLGPRRKTPKSLGYKAYIVFFQASLPTCGPRKREYNLYRELNALRIGETGIRAWGSMPGLIIETESSGL